MYNRAIIVGRLTADPELRQTPNGISVTSFSLAVDRPYRSGTERQTDFLDVVAWRQLAEFVCRYFAKGRSMLVEGAIQVRQYTDKNGQNRRAWEIIADNIRFVESKNAAMGESVPLPAESSAPSAPPPAYQSGSVDDFAEIDDDGDLPF